MNSADTIKLIEATLTKVQDKVMDFDEKMRGVPQAHIASALVNELLAHLATTRSELIKEHCPHQWVSLKSPVIQNGSLCTDCGSIDSREPDELVIAFPGTTLHP